MVTMLVNDHPVGIYRRQIFFLARNFIFFLKIKNNATERALTLPRHDRVHQTRARAAGGARNQTNIC